MPTYKNPETGITQDMSAETATLFPYLILVAEESVEEAAERSRREAARAAASDAKVDDDNAPPALELDENGNVTNVQTEVQEVPDPVAPPVESTDPSTGGPAPLTLGSSDDHENQGNV